jgi:DNA primase
MRDDTPALSEADILAILGWAEFEFTASSLIPGKLAQGACPVHPGADNPDGFVAYFDSRKYGSFVCLTHHCLREGKYQGTDAFGFVAAVLDEKRARSMGVTRDMLPDASRTRFGEAKRTIESLLGRSLGEMAKQDFDFHQLVDKQLSRLIAPKPTSAKVLLEQELERYKHFHPYLLNRFFTREIMDLFECGYDPVTERITFPFRDIEGNLITIVKRVVDDSKVVKKKQAQALGVAPNPKYIHGVFPKGDHLYNMWRVRNIMELRKGLTCSAHPGILVTEGQLDVMRLHQYGFPLAVATGGTAFTENHGKLLEQYTDQITVILDSDQAGEDLVKAAKDVLGKFVTVYCARLMRPYNDVGDVIGEHGVDLIHYVLETRTRA